MGDIVTGGALEDSLEAIRWIAAHDGGTLDEGDPRRHLEIVVKAVKAMRAGAAERSP
jgi:hypothetical protein